MGVVFSSYAGVSVEIAGMRDGLINIYRAWCSCLLHGSNLLYSTVSGTEQENNMFIITNIYGTCFPLSLMFSVCSNANGGGV